jgi:hypothetical protein
MGNFSFYGHTFNPVHYVVLGTGHDLVEPDVVEPEGKFP